MDYYNSHSRRNSGSSHAHSTISQANSTRPILMPLEPPAAPFAVSPAMSRSSSPGRDSSSVSLSVNYLPTKFSAAPPGARRRKAGKPSALPKQGGGLDAFKSNEARMGGDDDDSGWFNGKEGGRTSRKLRWNKFKWMLFFANLVLTIYMLGGLICTLLTWFNVWKQADIVRVGSRTELVMTTVAATFGLLVSVIGWAGILTNNRSFLAVYTFLLWISLALLVVPGYLSYKRRSLNLEGKINAQWSRNLGAEGRLRIQNELGCCGYFSPYVEATVSQTCYARSVLPGCKKPYWDYQKVALQRWYTIVFSLVPAHILIMIIALLCSNHVTYRFGKGMMPKAYRLSMNSMAVIMDNYASQLAEQYGTDVASEIMSRSRSNLALNESMTYPSQQTTRDHHKYDSLARAAPEGAN